MLEVWGIHYSFLLSDCTLSLVAIIVSLVFKMLIRDHAISQPPEYLYINIQAKHWRNFHGNLTIYMLSSIFMKTMLIEIWQVAQNQTSSNDNVCENLYNPIFSVYKSTDANNGLRSMLSLVAIMPCNKLFFKPMLSHYEWNPETSSMEIVHIKIFHWLAFITPSSTMLPPSWSREKCNNMYTFNPMALENATYIIELGQYWLRWWLCAWQHQAIIWTDTDLSPKRSCGIRLSEVLLERHTQTYILFSFQILRGWSVLSLWQQNPLWIRLWRANGIRQHVL